MTSVYEKCTCCNISDLRQDTQCLPLFINRE
jgi:hypothetical protein